MCEFKYGAHQFLWTEQWDDNCISILDHVRELGLDCFEISLGDNISFHAEMVRDKACMNGLELTVGPGNNWPMKCDISSESRANQKLGLAWHCRIIKQAADIGAVAYNGAIYGHPGNVLRRRPEKSEIERVARNLYEVAGYAESLNVKLVIEPMSRFRTHLLNTAKQAVELISNVNHKNIYINLDTYHMITEERDYAKAIKNCGTWLWGIHACENDRGVPGGGLVPWNEVFKALKETNPGARVLMETYNTGKNGFGFKRGIFQNVCPNAAGFVKTGSDFLKQQAAKVY